MHGVEYGRKTGRDGKSFSLNISGGFHLSMCGTYARDIPGAFSDSSYFG